MGVKFNELLLEFLEELSLVFPENPELKTYSAIATSTSAQKPDLPAKLYLQATGLHAFKIKQKDPVFFEDCPTIMHIDIRSLWKKDLSDTTRDVIWTYLQELQLLALEGVLPTETINKLQDVENMLPPDTVNRLQDIARDVTAKIEQGTVDPSQLLKMFGIQGLLEQGPT